ncbi:glycosyltransferase [Algoriphagus sp. SE2]|uniref:glycosyltransferase n=1 Tax=Algoriphagus sp. SE2 TaxID=3141536 RepID=UPI0031CD4611
MKISVIIPTFKEWEVLSNCLKALKSQSFPQESFEILIINNSPEDEIPVAYELPANAKVILQPKKGSYAARNMGVAYSSGQYIAFTDSDCIPKINWLEEGVKLLEAGYDLVGGKVELFKPEQGTELAFTYESYFSFKQKSNVLNKGQSVTANLFTKKEVLDKVGLFKENLLSGGDFEWTKRATGSGYKIGFGEQVEVFHPSRRTISQLVKKRRRTMGGMYIREFKHYSFRQKISYALFTMRPHVTIFGYKGISIKKKFQLFFATWYVECLGVKEILLLDLKMKSVERV